MSTWPDITAVKAEVWRETLEDAAGNITHAALLFGITKRQAMYLTREHGLNDYAAELRVSSGQGRKGRPSE